jgi:hypothetical protein
MLSLQDIAFPARHCAAHRRGDRFREAMAAAHGRLAHQCARRDRCGGFVIFSASASNGNNPIAVAAQIVSGIGFLGAGVILREGINVRGLNTAATLWCSAMVGTFAGAGLLLASALAALSSSAPIYFCGRSSNR